MPSDKRQRLNIQTCILKVNVNCHGCSKKVKKILKKIEGVYTVNIDAEEQRVIVNGIVDSATLIKKLVRSGKHAEVWTPKSKQPDHSQQQRHQGKNKNHPKNYQSNNSKRIATMDDLYGGSKFDDEYQYEEEPHMDLEAAEFEKHLMSLSGNRFSGDEVHADDINSMINMMGIHDHQDNYLGCNLDGSVGSSRNNLQKFQDYSAGSPAYGYQQPSPLMMANLLIPQYNQNPYAGWLRTNPQSLQAIMNDRVLDEYMQMQHQY